jgi:hypothetical protein
LLAVGLASWTTAQTVIYTEGFNDDGEAASPQRYTTTGRGVFEVPAIQSVLGYFDQKGPMYWAHNFEVSYVGNPTIPGRRVIFTWRGDTAGAATEQLLTLFDSITEWLLEGKPNAQIVVNPSVASIQVLADRLTAAGHTVIGDDTTTYPDDLTVPGDLFIHGPLANNPSRFVLSPKPVININSPDYDDMLVGSIGTSVAFTPGQVTIAAAGHPAAGGLTGSFDAFTAEQTFELVGSFLPTNTTTLATVTRIIPPAVNNLADVDAMIDGTKEHEETSGTAISVDFSDASPGNWFDDLPLPGGYTGNWGLRASGTLNVATAGTYRFAVGSDDGARLMIDLDRNGITPADTVIEDAGPHAHQLVYVDVTFPATGDYDFEVRAYNSGGGGSLEVSVSTVTVPVPDDAIESGYWDLLGIFDPLSPVILSGDVAVTAYVAAGGDVAVQTPLAVLLNGPADDPPGAFYDGGPFSNFEGTGFFAGSGLNKVGVILPEAWPWPAGQTYRSVRLQPVNVAGMTNVQLTVALAATVVDFEDSDLLDIVAYPNGAGSAPVTLAHFRGVQNAIQPWMADQVDNFVRRLTRRFADFTYDIPEGATDLVIEFRMATTWWTEIAAFDNVRITQAGAVPALVLQSSSTVTGGYADDPSAVIDAGAKTITIPLPTGTRFFRAAGQAVQLSNPAVQGGNLVISYE